MVFYSHGLFFIFAALTAFLAMSTSEELDHDLGNFDLLPGVTFHYSFWSKAAAYSQAEAHCQESLHGHLVSILSKEELQFLENGLKKVDPVPTAVWIGLSGSQDGDLEWTDGSLVNFTSGLAKTAALTCYSWDIVNQIWLANTCTALKASVCKQFVQYHTTYDFGERGKGLLTFYGAPQNRSDAHEICNNTLWREAEKEEKIKNKYGMTLVSVSIKEEADVIREIFFQLPYSVQISHRFQWIGLYQESAYYEHNEWEDGLLSRYRRPGARFLNLFKRCVHWDMITDTWSDDFECSEELAFICMQPAYILHIRGEIDDPMEAPGAKTIGMVFLILMATFVGLLMLCDIPTMIARGRKVCCRNLSYMCRQPRSYKKVHVAASSSPSPDDTSNNTGHK